MHATMLEEIRYLAILKTLFLSCAARKSLSSFLILKFMCRGESFFNFVISALILSFSFHLSWLGLKNTYTWASLLAIYKPILEGLNFIRRLKNE